MGSDITKIKFNLVVIDLLDLYYTIYSDILINKDKYSSNKNTTPVLCYSLMLNFLNNMYKKNCDTDVKYFFYLRKHDIRSIDLKKIKNSISKREKNIDYHFEYFFNIFVEILKSYKDNYYIILDTSKLLNEIINLNKDKNIIIVSKKMNKCNYLMYGDNIYWYNHVSSFNRESFVSFYKFTPTKDKIDLYTVLIKKPVYKTKLYKNFSIPHELSVYITDTFSSFDDFFQNYSKLLSEDMRKKIYSSMKILLINKQSSIDKDYSVFDLDENYIYTSKHNPSKLGIWKKILKLEL